jgi:hypothetical protein
VAVHWLARMLVSVTRLRAGRLPAHQIQLPKLAFVIL